MKRWLVGLIALAIVIAPNLTVARSLVAQRRAQRVAVVQLATALGPVAIPRPRAQIAAPALSASSWYAIDLASGVTLAAHQATTQRPIASITKLATTLVILRDQALSSPVTVPTLPAYASDDEILHIQPGERFTTQALLSALLINSDDDVADALALANSTTQPAFVAKMNQLVEQWGVAEARFSNPSGLVDSGNGASTEAVANLAELALTNPTVRRLVATPSATIADSAGQSFTLTTTDELLQNGQFQGIKTGYTDAAGQCFVGLTTIQAHPVITVVLGSQDRFSDSTKLAAWINQTYAWPPSP